MFPEITETWEGACASLNIGFRLSNILLQLDDPKMADVDINVVLAVVVAICEGGEQAEKRKKGPEARREPLKPL